MERIKNEHIKEIMGVKGKPDIIDIIEKKKRTSKKNVDARSTSSHDKKKYRNKSMEKQRGMAFGFRKTATAVTKPDG